MAISSLHSTCSIALFHDFGHHRITSSNWTDTDKADSSPRWVSHIRTLKGHHWRDNSYHTHCKLWQCNILQEGVSIVAEVLSCPDRSWLASQSFLTQIRLSHGHSSPCLTAPPPKQMPTVTVSMYSYVIIRYFFHCFVFTMTTDQSRQARLTRPCWGGSGGHFRKYVNIKNVTVKHCLQAVLSSIRAEDFFQTFWIFRDF